MDSPFILSSWLSKNSDGRAILNSLQSFEITFQEYQAAYDKILLPIRTKLSSQGIKYLCDSEDFIPYYHLYTQNVCIEEIDKLVQNGKSKRVTDNANITRYVLSDTPVNSNFSF
jgi:hypothetical protein